jgi:predicted flavoprotein YhiN
MEKHDIIIIGGGASGIYLSLLLADYGKDVLVIEAKDRILKKLLTTGNGRCNITNESVMGSIREMYTSSKAMTSLPCWSMV